MSEMILGDVETALELAQLLRDRRGELFAVWTRRVLEDPAVPQANRMSEPALRDHLPLWIDQLIVALESHSREQGPGELTGRAVGSAEAAVNHADDRAMAHFSLSAALRELSHFRASLLELCDEAGLALVGGTARLVHAALDEAMATVAVAVEQSVGAATEFDRRRLRSVLDLLPVAVFITDATGRMVETNAAFESLWGADAPLADCLTDYSAYNATTPATGAARGAAAWALVRALTNGESCLDEKVEIITFDGTRRTVLDSAVPIRDVDGALVGAVGVQVDVTVHERGVTLSTAPMEHGAALVPCR